VKPDIHPDHHPVVFKDAITRAAFLTSSTVTSARTIGRPRAGSATTLW
jgi:large subunit ribosomal protein L31